jgi:hypothetical protein
MGRTGLALVAVLLRVSCEPGKGYRNATTDRLSGKEVTLSTREENRPLTYGLPVGKMRSL